MSSSQPVVLITGATSGIGRHAAHHLAARGHRVFAAGRNPIALAELARTGGSTLTPISLDVTDAASIEATRAAIEAATDGHGVDVLVNNAGYGGFAPLEQVSDEELRQQYDTNVFGLMAVTRAFLPAMRRRGEGRIVNISSIGGLVTGPLFGAYNSSKYAVEALSDALRLELGPFGIRVSLIEPGPVRTGFTSDALERSRRSADPSSPYAAVIARFEQIARRTDRIAPGPDITSRAIARAITARRPRARYLAAPLWARTTLCATSLMPTALLDRVMRRLVGLTPRTPAALDGRRS
jgi:NAD(P)-dependent dehydrogenase (short-subunit alcohol dehydrogenase family)